MSKRIPLLRPFWQDHADDWQEDGAHSRADVERLERQLSSLERLRRDCAGRANLIACTMLDKSIAETRHELHMLHKRLNAGGFVIGRLRRLVGGAR